MNSIVNMCLNFQFYFWYNNVLFKCKSKLYEVILLIQNYKKIIIFLKFDLI